jgi:spoIIIJ-associated protein
MNDETIDQTVDDETESETESETAETSEPAADAESAAPDDRGPAATGNRRPRRRRKAEDQYSPEGDERAALALKFVTDVVHEMEMDCRVRLKRPSEGDAEAEINIEITGRDSGRVIGKKGQVLGALQFLTHRVINRPDLERRHVLVDAEGYRSRRDNSLATMARRLGKQAVEEGKIITFEPMNPRDRRVVHVALAKFEGVVTKSEGEGDERRVQIIPVRR